MGCYSDYDGETAGPPFSCLTKNENFKNKWIILIDKKKQRPVLCINHFKEKFLRKWRESKEDAIDEMSECFSLKHVWVFTKIKFKAQHFLKSDQSECHQGSGLSREINMLILLQMTR